MKRPEKRIIKNLKSNTYPTKQAANLHFKFIHNIIMKPLIPFRFLEKYKYFYFTIGSFVMAVLVVLGAELFINEVGDFTVKHLMREIFFYWGFMYPVFFVAYEAARKENNKKSEK
jgi:hypothetical protein